jgi:Glycoside-hydrolase family GH114
MRSVPVSALILGVALVAGCKPDPHRPDAGPLPPDAYRPDAPPAYWVPVQGQAYDWDIQLAETPFNVSTARDIYMIDLWDAVPTARMIDYGDGTPVMVPAGSGNHANAIATIHAMNAKVICHVSTGAIHLDDPDAKKFPGYEANPPNRPTLPAAGSVIGWSTPVDMKERFIDITEGDTRTKVLGLIEKRLDLAKQIGCDSIVTRWNDQVAYQIDVDPTVGTGFMAGTTDEFRSWATALVGSARQRQLSTGLRAETAEGIAETSPIYDWLLYEKCAVDDMCNNVKPYIDARKPVFEIEYPADPTNPGILCTRVKAAGIINGIAKDAALSNMTYARCM